MMALVPHSTPGTQGEKKFKRKSTNKQHYENQVILSQSKILTYLYHHEASSKIGEKQHSYIEMGKVS